MCKYFVLLIDLLHLVLGLLAGSDTFGKLRTMAKVVTTYERHLAVLFKLNPIPTGTQRDQPISI